MAAGNERHDHMIDTEAHPENRKAAGFLFHPATARNLLLVERSWKPEIGGTHGGERRLRGKEGLRWWFGCCGNFDRKSSQSTPQFNENGLVATKFPICGSRQSAGTLSRVGDRRVMQHDLDLVRFSTSTTGILTGKAATFSKNLSNCRKEPY